MTSDLQLDITDHGTIALVRPMTAYAREWLVENVSQDEAHHWWGDSLVVEPRYLGPLLEGFLGDLPAS